ncbi:hypothetical protein [Microvirga vignae]|uniref:hypothetical protein n=1 Tax=Microvirga vignae TaxID=1225564 RepID=UPI00069B6DA2|nr:hypothetical protein [Microvirga vignae]
MRFSNNIVAQEHRRIKRLVGAGLGFKSFQTASQPTLGYQVMAVIRTSQVISVLADDMKAQSDFVARRFSAAA